MKTSQFETVSKSWSMADHKQCLGARLGYLEILQTHHFDLARVERALGLFEL
jgi:hypothetical protein